MDFGVSFNFEIKIKSRHYHSWLFLPFDRLATLWFFLDGTEGSHGLWEHGKYFLLLSSLSVTLHETRSLTSLWPLFVRQLSRSFSDFVCYVISIVA